MGSMEEADDLRLLFHRLNNQLGIILAHAELLEAKAGVADVSRSRSAQIVSSTLEAMATAREIHRLTCDPQDVRKPSEAT